MRYKILINVVAGLLEDEVQAHLNLGWEPLGSLCVLDGGGNLMFVQAITKKLL